MHQTGNERACGVHDQPHAEIRRVRRFDPIAFEAAVRALLEASGIEIDSAHTGRTAQRVRELWQRRLLDGYEVDPAQALGAGFDDPREDMVIVRSIAVHGVCPHHLLPFRGVAHVAYLPGGRLHGFGRIARMIDAISHRYTYQEWITHRIATALVTHGQARGAACLIEAEQLCLLMGENRRGDERVITQCYAGEFERDVHPVAVQAGRRIDDRVFEAARRLRRRIGVERPGLDRGQPGGPQVEPGMRGLLPVEIGERDPCALRREIPSQIGGQRALADAALRIRHHDHRHEFPRRSRATRRLAPAPRREKCGYRER